MIILEQSAMFPSKYAKLEALFHTKIAMGNHKAIATFN